MKQNIFFAFYFHVTIYHRDVKVKILIFLLSTRVSTFFTQNPWTSFDREKEPAGQSSLGDTGLDDSKVITSMSTTNQARDSPKKLKDYELQMSFRGNSTGSKPEAAGSRFRSKENGWQMNFP